MPELAPEEQENPAVPRIWHGRNADEAYAAVLAEQTGLHPLVARVLLARGFSDAEDIEWFLHPSRDNLYNPSLLPDVDRACARIHAAIQAGERILVYGDFDVDGVTSVALLVRTLRTLGAEVSWFVPSREQEYGLHPDVMQDAADKGFRLVITVDVGITGNETADVARACGIDLIITDYHHVPRTLPKAYAIVHPDVPTNKSMYPFKELCGAGVTFKLVQRLLDRFPEEHLQLVALATIADQVPLVRENRILVTEGLEQLNRHPLPGLDALGRAARLAAVRAGSTHVAFQLVPRINAMGRLGGAGEMVRLLLTDDPLEAASLAEAANAKNQTRRVMQQAMQQEADAQLVAHPAWRNDRTLVVAGEHWPPGLVGLVAGKLAETQYKPTLCLRVEGEHARGSGRSVPDIDLYGILAAVQAETGVFTRFDGHAGAAGFSLLAQDIPRLREAFARHTRQQWPEDVPQRAVLEVDAPLDLADLSYGLTDALKKLEPFGAGNPEPVWFVKAAPVSQAGVMGTNGQHLWANVQDRFGRAVKMVAFGKGDEIDTWQAGCRRHLLVRVGENVWGGRTRLQLQLVDGRDAPTGPGTSLT